MRFLVTGGAGFIGSNFLNRWVPRCSEHTFLNVDCLNYAGNPFNLNPLRGAQNYSLLREDITDGEGMLRIFKDFRPDVVVQSRIFNGRAALAKRVGIALSIRGSLAADAGIAP